MAEKIATEEPKVYTADEAAKVLKIGRTTIYKLMDNGKLRYAKVGARRLIPAAELNRLINDSMVA